MKRRFASKPTPAVSAVAAVVGIVILLIGIGAMSHAREIHPVLILWIVGVVFIVGYHLINAFSTRAPALEILEEVDEPPKPRTVTDRLLELDRLREQQLLSDEEYIAKRGEILNDI